MKLSKTQILLIASATLYLIGAIFMLINTFKNTAWSFWLGLVFAILATALYIFMAYYDKKARNNSYGKIESTQTTESQTPQNGENKNAQSDKVTQNSPTKVSPTKTSTPKN